MVLLLLIQETDQCQLTFLIRWPDIQVLLVLRGLHLLDMVSLQDM